MGSGERIALQPAWILHRRPYRESSLLVEAFSEEHGRVGLVARGARGGRGRLVALLQPFRPLLLSWSGRGELRTLTDAEPGGPVPVLPGRATLSGFYVNELMLRLLAREDPHPELFGCYAACLAGLGVEEGWSLRRFERDLLQALGYGLALEADAQGEPLSADALYDYRLEQGAVPCSTVTAGMLPVHGRTLMALAQECAPGPQVPVQVQGEARRLLRAALSVYLGDRPLESRALYRQALGLLPGVSQQEEQSGE